MTPFKCFYFFIMVTHKGHVLLLATLKETSVQLLMHAKIQDLLDSLSHMNRL